MKMQKRGLSDVVTTVIIILLVIAAIAIIWSFVQPTLRGAGEDIEDSTDCFTLSLEPVSCDFSGTGASAIGNITVRRNAGSADLSEVRLVVEFASGNTQVFSNSTALPQELGQQVYLGLGFDDTPASVTVAGVVGQGNVCPASSVEVSCT